MEAVVVGLVLNKLSAVIIEGHNLRGNVESDLQFIKRDMAMLKPAIEKCEKYKHHPEWVLQAKELAYDIEDRLDIFQAKVACEPEMPWNRRLLHQLKTVGIRSQFAKDLKKFKGRVEDLSKQWNQWPSHDDVLAAPAPEPESLYTPEADLVGIAKPKEELLELLSEKEKPRRVVSIVGPRGIGKTTLARVVYEDSKVALQFPCRAWVVASKLKDAAGLLAAILREFQATGATSTFSSPSCDAAFLGKNLNKHLQAKRYLIVIDDMQTSLWNSIASSFPDKDGRIILTTSLHSVANTCSHIYRMQALSDTDAEVLLMNKVFGPGIDCSSDFKMGSKSILKKCDGLPLGIVNIAYYLRSIAEPITGKDCENVCKNLGRYMQIRDYYELTKMKEVLSHSYDNLSTHEVKTCLLSVSIYPKNQPIKRKSLVRRWLAEGLVDRGVRLNNENEAIAGEHFKVLVDRNILQPVDINNAGVKTCQLHGIMLDLIVQKSATENFITLIHNDEVIRNPNSEFAVRRLSVHKPDEEGSKTMVKMEKTRIRSLTIFGHVGQSLLKFHKCKLLRVLDLENCDQLTDCDLDSICKLLRLKYLSLRGTNVGKLPKKISKLHHLETLDIRGTKVNILPMEVLTLPQLTHLFGRFKLPRELSRAVTRGSRDSLSSGDSKLQSLAGFVMDDENRSFEQIMLNMKKLRKVKIWAESTLNSETNTILASSLNGCFIGDKPPLESLSVDFGDHSIGFLDSLDEICALSSIKLRGKLSKLPTFVMSLKSLSELHLISTGLDSDVLSALQGLRKLSYLRLVEDHLEFGNASFSVEGNGFQSLQRLCIQGPKLPKVSVAEGAMQQLYSLQLICEEISGFGEAGIKLLKGLKEVTLATSVDEATKISWQAAAKQHKNRPLIIYKDNKAPK